MKLSRKVWGACVLALGLLWVGGGIAGYLQGKGVGLLLMVFCGVALLRLGWNMTR